MLLTFYRKIHYDYFIIVIVGTGFSLCNIFLLQQKALYGAVEMNCSVDDVERLMKNGANPSYHDPNDSVGY